MSDPYRHFPTVILEDRYGGTYSGGAWIAVGGWYHYTDPKPESSDETRFQWVEGIAHGDDFEAAEGLIFATLPWIGLGATPDAALADLMRKGEPTRRGLAPEGRDDG